MNQFDPQFDMNLELEELLVVIGMFIHSGSSLNEIDDEVIYKLYSLISKETSSRKDMETFH